MSTSPLEIQVQIAGLDAEIVELEARITQLRRRRNSLLPISTLPPELVVTIIKLLIDDAIVEMEQAPYSALPCAAINPPIRAEEWIQLTHVYAYWREVALNCPALWSFVFPMSTEGLETFRERSRGYPFYVGAINCTQHAGVSEFLIDNMSRIRSLLVWPGALDRSSLQIQDKCAPQLEVLKFSNHNVPNWQERPMKSPIVMPKLRVLEVSGHASYDWRCLLPAQLPTVTDLFLTHLGHEDELNILERCRGVRRLTVRCAAKPIPALQPTTKLPKLSHLKLHTIHWPLFFHLLLPSIQHVDIEWKGYAHEVSWFFTKIEQMVSAYPSNNDPTQSHARARLSRLAVTYHPGRAARMAFEDEKGAPVLTVTAGVASNAPFFFRTLCRSAQSLDIGIYAVGVGVVEDACGWGGSGVPDLRGFFGALRAVRGVTAVCVADASVLDCFLDREGQAHGSWFPGLSTLSVGGGGVGRAGAGGLGDADWERLVLWAEDRKWAGLGVEKMAIGRGLGRPEGEVLDRIERAVGSLVVEG